MTLGVWVAGAVGLIVNARSHTVARRGATLTAVAALLGAERYPEAADFATLERDIARLAAAGVTRLIVEGGDGTLLAVLSAALSPAAGFGRPPEFGVLAGGSTNLAARLLGLRARAPAALARRIAGPAGDAVVHQRALCVAGPGLAPPEVGFVLSTGSLARAMGYTQRAFHRQGRRGSLAVAGAIARFVAAPGAFRDTDGAPVLRPSRLRAEGGGAMLDGDHAFSLMTPLPRLSLGLAPFWGEGDGAIAMTHAGWPVGGFRRAMLKVLAGRAGAGLAAHGLTSWRGDRFEIDHDGPVMIDGELRPAAAGRLSVTATLPLRFLR